MSHLRRLAAGLALCTFAVTATVAHAQEAEDNQCIETALVLEGVNKQFPISRHAVLDPEQTARVVDWYNSEPPVSDESWNLVVVLRHTNGSFGLLFGNDGKVCEATPVPPQVDGLVRAITGGRGVMGPGRSL